LPTLPGIASPIAGASRYDNKRARIRESIIIKIIEASMCFASTITDPITENLTSSPP
jgi:hypothetical protein